MSSDRPQSPPTPTQLRRKNTGEPGNGGLYAGHALAGSGLDLSQVADPWAADPAPEQQPAPWDEPAPTTSEQVRDIGTRVSTAMSDSWRDYRSGMDRESFMALEDARVGAVKALDREYGSVEQAVTHAGGLVAERGFELAGITDVEVAERYQTRLAAADAAADEAEQRWLAAKAQVDAGLQHRIDAAVRAVVRAREEEADPELLDALVAEKNRLQEERGRAWGDLEQVSADAKKHAWLIRNAMDEDTKADLARLTGGYLEALAQVRELGGQLVLSDRSKPAAVRAFEEAAAIFPSDWVAASNERVGGQKVNRNGYSVPDRAPVVKIGRSRAHYADSSVETTKKRVPVQRNYPESLAVRYLDEQGRSTSPHYEVRPLTPQEREQSSGSTHRMTEYEVASSYLYSEDRPPRGRGWERWTSPDGDRSVWRRVRHRMETVDMTSMPEITTNAAAPLVAGRSETFAVSVHELSHRMEASVPGLKSLEESFLRRRRTDPVTGREEGLIRLYPRSKEYAYKDGFNIAYTGKVYEDGYREILSTGMDQVFGGRNGAGLGLGNSTADPDHRNFVLGLLATAGVRSPAA